VKEFVKLMIDAKTENLGAVQDFIISELEAAGCPAGMQTQIIICAEEIFVNIAHYAYNQAANPEICGAAIYINAGDKDKDGEIIIMIEDSGVPFNPLERESPDINARTDEREIGGLGIYMVRQMMDSVEYCHKNGKNILTLKKRIKQIKAT